MLLSKSKIIVYSVLLFILVAINSQYHLKKYIVELYLRLYMHNKPFVVSFSTTPHRIDKISKTIETIFQQKLKPTKVYLSLPYIFKRDNLPYHIPEWLANDKRITILRTEDYGPGTKLLGVLEQVKLNPEEIIITVDDDITYPEETFLHLAYYAYKHPDQAVGISGVDIQYDIDGLVTQNSISGLIPGLYYHKTATVLQGFASAAYRVGFFDESIFDIVNTPQECINSDDIYISYHLAKKNIPRFGFWSQFMNQNMIDFKNSIGLSADALHKLIPTPAQKHRTCIKYLREQDPYVVF